MRWFERMFFRRRLRSELSEEIRVHIEESTEELLANGMSIEEAQAAARRVFGNVTLIEQDSSEAWRWPRLEDFLSDVRYGLRMLVKNPGFAAVTILTLALGIGANTAMFSVIDSVLLNPIPFPEPNGLVDVYVNWPQFPRAPLSYANFLDLQRDNHSFQRIAVWRLEWFTLTGSGEPERLAGQMISADFLSVLKVQPVLGRSFRTEEDTLGATPVVMLGERLWIRRFGSDPAIIGRTVTVNGRMRTVVGVVPSSVRLLQIEDSYFDEVFVPVGQWDNSLLRDRRFSLGLRTVARLKPGVSLTAAQAEMDRLQNSLADAYPNANAGLTLQLARLKDDQIGDARPLLLMLWGAVGLVLLIACANVANLLLARSTGRHQELAIRAALGASRARIVRQLLLENILLVVIGGTIGILLAKWGTRSVLALLPAVLPATSQVEINSRVLLFAAALSFLTGMLFGLAPALQLSRSRLQETLRESGHRIAGSHRSMQAVFVAVEIGLALALLCGAGLLIRSLQNVWSVNPGFDPAGILTCKVSFSPEKMSNPAKAMETIRELSAQLAPIRGANSVAVALGGLPFDLDSEVPIWPHDKPKPEKLAAWPLAVSYIVGPGYFDTLRIPLVRGRDFTAQDHAAAPSVIIIDDHLAKGMFPGQDPVGKQLDFGAGTSPAEIVGVVGHVARWGFDTPANSVVAFEIYSPALQVSGPVLPLVTSATTLMLRSDGSPTNLLEPIRKTVRSLDSSAVVYDVRTMHEVIARSFAERRFSMLLLGVFAGLALVLATIGVYGVVSYLVGQRTREIGIHMALGAERRDILREVLGQGLKMALAGTALGLLASFGLTRLMTAMLFGVRVTDPFTYAAATMLLLTVATSACWIPARRATRLDPMVVLRHE